MRLKRKTATACSIDTETERRIRATAAAIRQKIGAVGAVTVLIDDEGRAVAMPGYRVELVGVYDQFATAAWIAEDLLHVGARR